MEAQLPKYQCHKQVWALKIKSILYTHYDPKLASAQITPEDERFTPFFVDSDYCKRHSPAPGGYFVQYEGGYISYSPQKEFEDGYTLIE